MRSPVNHARVFAALLMAAAGGAALAARPDASVASPSGPAADFPVTIGEPFAIGTTTWTPSDQLNYDAVGLSDVQQGLAGVSAAHKTLPLPSYVEVTSLATGRTILVRLVERGPMINETLLALSPEAAAQLGIEARAPVRVRRVNPPEIERAALRAGGRVPQRMDTPESLLKVLRRKLAEQSPLLPPPSTPPKMPAGVLPEPTAASATSKNADIKRTAEPVAAPEAAVVPKTNAATARAMVQKQSESEPAAQAAQKGGAIVQVAAFSSAERARTVAKTLSGSVSQAGRVWRVRLGPFTNAKTAAAALGKAKAAGYSDARIQRRD